MKKEGILGLILSGGKSRRMGTDKGALQYHNGMAHREYLAQLIDPFCIQTFISCRSEQNIRSAFGLIVDGQKDIGPLAGIVSAFEAYPDSAWLTIACDYPFLDAATIDTLVASRNMDKMATCFFNKERDCPEPLLTIWEPAIFSVLQKNIAERNLSPLKILKSTDIQLVPIPDPNKLINVNDPDQRARII